MAVADAQLYRGAEKGCCACPKAAGLPLLNLQSSSIHTSVEGKSGEKKPLSPRTIRRENGRMTLWALQIT